MGGVDSFFFYFRDVSFKKYFKNRNPVTSSFSWLYDYSHFTFLKLYPETLAQSADIHGLSLTIGSPKKSAFFFIQYFSCNALR